MSDGRPTPGKQWRSDDRSPRGARPPSLVVIGYGNPLREDDGVGWAAADLLKQALPADRVRVFTCHQLMPELAEPVSLADAVLFIDARVDGVAGALDLRPIAPDAEPPAGLSHVLSPGALLALARQVYGRCAPAQLASITGGAFGYAEGLSPAVRAALPKLVARARVLLQA